MFPSDHSASAQPVPQSCPAIPRKVETPQRPSASALLAGPFVSTVSFAPSDADSHQAATFPPKNVIDLPTPSLGGSSRTSYSSARDEAFPANTSTFQYSVHKPGRHLLRELALVLPEAKANSALPELLVIPVFQRSVYDLIAVSPETNWERDLLLEYVRVTSLKIMN
ncbi:hypothetical protein PhCBS80983_g01696 [Powellomyces hirtus]|uniref:Uncharacterized protein n=1 Tax=Powellomyces hirtus TaxID=109895 RepID=A0A507E8X1_9FUNG|nr:hypothetical protein PhCBS80983_g01696 [Powellomyces hirtus]